MPKWLWRRNKHFTKYLQGQKIGFLQFRLTYAFEFKQAARSGIRHEVYWKLADFLCSKWFPVALDCKLVKNLKNWHTKQKVPQKCFKLYSATSGCKNHTLQLCFSELQCGQNNSKSGMLCKQYRPKCSEVCFTFSGCFNEVAEISSNFGLKHSALV